MRRLLPLLAFVALALLLGVGVYMSRRTDRTAIASPLIGRPAPDFSLPVLGDPTRRIGNRDLLGEPFLLNVNIPSLPFEHIKGYRATRLGKRHPSQPVITQVNPRGDTNYWIGPAGDARDASEGTDFHATAAGYVSLTPLQLDLTHRGQLDALDQWLK